MQQETVIEFRPLYIWKGEFGFDWMRIYEGSPVGHTSTGITYSSNWHGMFLGPEEMPYIDGAIDAATTYPRPYEANAETGIRHRPAGIAGKGIVWGGFHPSSPLVEMSAAKAQEKLKKEYKSFEIARPGPLSYRLKTYYIPWLNLFPDADAGVSAAVAGAPSLKITTPPPRLSEVSLHLFYDAKNQPPGKLVIEFDKNFIEVNGDNTGSYTLSIPSTLLTPTPTNHVGSVRLIGSVKSNRSGNTVLNPSP
jgi:hypothetical protein